MQSMMNRRKWRHKQVPLGDDLIACRKLQVQWIESQQQVVPDSMADEPGASAVKVRSSISIASSLHAIVALALHQLFPTLLADS
jgi:hypothetical protein